MLDGPATPDGPATSQETRKSPEATAQRPVPSTEVLKRLEGTQRRAMKVPSARAPLASTLTGEMQEASPHAEARALAAAAADLEAPWAGGDDRNSSDLWPQELGYGETSHAAKKPEHRQMVCSDGSGICCARPLLGRVLSRICLGAAGWPEDIFVTGRSEQRPGCRHAD